MGFSDYNSNPDLNVSISGVNIGEGCPPSGINNAIRQIMADAKTADGGYVKGTTSGGSQIVSSSTTFVNSATFSGGVTISGGIKNNVTMSSGATFSGDIVMNKASANSYVFQTNNAYALGLHGGNNVNNGASLYLHGILKGDRPGAFVIGATDGVDRKELDGRPDGTLRWAGGNVVVVSGGQADIKAANTTAILHIEGQTVTSSSVTGYAWELQGKTNGQRGIYDPQGGKWALVENSAGSVVLSGTVAGSSDERLKGGIATIPDKTLDAWGKVDWRQYRYKADGAGAPVHFGVVAQHVSSCLAKGGIHVADYAIVENKGLKGEAGAKDEWSVYYQEAFALEAAYQRRRADKAEERIAALERRLDALEAAFVATGA